MNQSSFRGDPRRWPAAARCCLCSAPAYDTTPSGSSRVNLRDVARYCAADYRPTHATLYQAGAAEGGLAAQCRAYLFRKNDRHFQKDLWVPLGQHSPRRNECSDPALDFPYIFGLAPIKSFRKCPFLRKDARASAAKPPPAALRLSPLRARPRTSTGSARGPGPGASFVRPTPKPSRGGNGGTGEPGVRSHPRTAHPRSLVRGRPLHRRRHDAPAPIPRPAFESSRGPPANRPL